MANAPTMIDVNGKFLGDLSIILHAQLLKKRLAAARKGASPKAASRKKTARR
jgi:hypothetical protein